LKVGDAVRMRLPRNLMEPRAQDGGRSPDLQGEDPDPPTPVIQEDVTSSPPASVPDNVGPDFGDLPRRSGRSRRPPVWLKAFNLC